MNELETDAGQATVCNGLLHQTSHMEKLEREPPWASSAALQLTVLAANAGSSVGSRKCDVDDGVAGDISCWS